MLVVALDRPASHGSCIRIRYVLKSLICTLLKSFWFSVFCQHIEENNHSQILQKVKQNKTQNFWSASKYLIILLILKSDNNWKNTNLNYLSMIKNHFFEGSKINQAESKNLQIGSFWVSD